MILFLWKQTRVVGSNPGTGNWMDIISHIYFCKNCKVCIKLPKINDKKRPGSHFLIKMRSFLGTRTRTAYHVTKIGIGQRLYDSLTVTFMTNSPGKYLGNIPKGGDAVRSLHVD